MLTYTREDKRPYSYYSDVITITSQTGVGSTSAMKALRAELRNDSRMRFVSGGQIMRDAAASLGLSIEDFAAHNLAHPEDGYDRFCDDQIAAYGSQNFAVIEGRLPHVFVPMGFHVKLVCEAEIRAQRRCADTRGGSLDAIRSAIVERDRCDNERYETLYPGCHWPDSDYDLVINTGIPGQRPLWVCQEILTTHQKWRERNRHRLCFTIVDLTSPR